MQLGKDDVRSGSECKSGSGSHDGKERDSRLRIRLELPDQLHPHLRGNSAVDPDEPEVAAGVLGTFGGKTRQLSGETFDDRLVMRKDEELLLLKIFEGREDKRRHKCR